MTANKAALEALKNIERYVRDQKRKYAVPYDESVFKDYIEQVRAALSPATDYVLVPREPQDIQVLSCATVAPICKCGVAIRVEKIKEIYREMVSAYSA